MRGKNFASKLAVTRQGQDRG